MLQLELEIARQLGASAFLVHAVLKNRSNLTRRELEIETGLSDKCIQTTTQKMVDAGIVFKHQTHLGKNVKLNRYSLNDSLEWRLQ